MVKVGRKRSVWVGIVVVAVFFACVTLAVAWLGGGPDVPHAVDGGQAACTTCHPVDRLPDDHHDRVDAGCRSCHSEAPAEAGVAGD
jgi:flagellar basal body-associated protein FliL